MLYFQIMVLESFASIIGALLTMPAATMLRSKNAKPHHHHDGVSPPRAT